MLDSNLRHVRTIRQWRGEFGTAPPFDIGPDALFVAYSAWAEMTCFMHWAGNSRSTSSTCTPPIWRPAISCCPYNPDEVRKKQRKRLSDACRAYRIPGWERIDKETIAKDIGEGRWRDYGQEAVYDYCEEDVRASTALLLKQLQGFARLSARQCDAPAALVELQRQGDRADPSARHADRHAAVESGAGEQGRGHRRSATAIRSRATAATTRSTRRTAIGATTGSSNWLVSVGVTAWPRLESGQDPDSTATPSGSCITCLASRGCTR